MTIVDAYVSELGRAIHGPARARRSMLCEVRDGLVDAAEAHEQGGLPPTAAQARAVAEFGSVAELAEAYQAELTVRRGRATAVYVAVVFPAMMLGWGLMWAAGVSWGPPLDPATHRVMGTLSTMLDASALIAAVAAAALFGLTFLRAVPPRAVTALAGATAGVGGLATSGLAVWLNLASGKSAAAALSAPAPALVAYAVSATMLVTTFGVAAGALRTAIVANPARACQG